MEASKTKRPGRQRDPAKLARVLTELSADDPRQFREHGTPPYNVADLAERLQTDAHNLRAYLLGLERDGLVIRERRKVSTWNAIARAHMPRTCLCFWNAATMERDRAAAQQWEAGAASRAEQAFSQMFKPYNPSKDPS